MFGKSSFQMPERRSAAAQTLQFVLQLPFVLMLLTYASLSKFICGYAWSGLEFSGTPRLLSKGMTGVGFDRNYG